MAQSDAGTEHKSPNSNRTVSSAGSGLASEAGDVFSQMDQKEGRVKRDAFLFRLRKGTGADLEIFDKIVPEAGVYGEIKKVCQN